MCKIKWYRAERKKVRIDNRIRFSRDHVIKLNFHRGPVRKLNIGVNSPLSFSVAASSIFTLTKLKLRLGRWLPFPSTLNSPFRPRSTFHIIAERFWLTPWQSFVFPSARFRWCESSRKGRLTSCSKSWRVFTNLWGSSSNRNVGIVEA